MISAGPYSIATVASQVLVLADSQTEIPQFAGLCETFWRLLPLCLTCSSLESLATYHQQPADRCPVDTRIVNSSSQQQSLKVVEELL